jgi:pimeloyl-ACP methyl ester carboxylesterase
MNPPVKLSVRQQPSGGPVAPQVRVDGGSLDGNSRVLILIHGYNNSFEEASGEYNAFLSILGSKFPTLMLQPAEFFWPGDTPDKVISTLTYSQEIAPAILSAQRLAAFLAQLRGPQGQPVEVSLVGQSLGGRVILELMAQWTGGVPANLRPGVVVLMAAAVLVNHVDDGGQLRAAATTLAGVSVQYSKGDWVLGLTFPLGETIAKEGFFPSAVGFTGAPPRTWGSAQAMATATGEPYGHFSYWNGDESCAAVAFALGGAPARPVPVNGLVSHPVPFENVIRTRATAVRSLFPRVLFAGPVR